MIDTQSSDEILVEILQQKSGRNVHKAMDLLYARYSNRMLEYFYYSFNKDKEKAQDFVQDLFLKLLEKPERFDTSRKFKSWVFSVASNMCKNEYRSIGTVNKYNEQIFHELKNASDSLPEPNFSINAAISQLKDDYKNHIILRYKFKMSVREISEVLECPEGTVRSKLFYATKELSKNLTKVL